MCLPACLPAFLPATLPVHARMWTQQSGRQGPQASTHRLSQGTSCLGFGWALPSQPLIAPHLQTSGMTAFGLRYGTHNEFTLELRLRTDLEFELTKGGGCWLQWIAGYFCFSSCWPCCTSQLACPHAPLSFIAARNPPSHWSFLPFSHPPAPRTPPSNCTRSRPCTPYPFFSLP